MGRPQELINRHDAEEAEAAVDEGAGIAGEGLRIARDRDGGSDRRRSEGFGHRPRAGPGRIEDDGIVPVQGAGIRGSRARSRRSAVSRPALAAGEAASVRTASASPSIAVTLARRDIGRLKVPMPA